MSESLLDIVPAEHREKARAALAAAFGRGEADELQPVVGGVSGALTYRVAVAGRSYLLRMETRRSPLRNPHQYACMRIAADAGIAPSLRHADAEAGVAVMDFVCQRPHGDYPGGPSALARDLGRLAARLQKTPTFPRLWDFPLVVERIFGF